MTTAKTSSLDWLFNINYALRLDAHELLPLLDLSQPSSPCKHAAWLNADAYLGCSPVVVVSSAAFAALEPCVYPDVSSKAEAGVKRTSYS
jgi:hypothetical protein